jgi:hypothetical protein
MIDEPSVKLGYMLGANELCRISFGEYTRNKIFLGGGTDFSTYRSTPNLTDSMS